MSGRIMDYATKGSVSMALLLEPYLDRKDRLPKSGHHILAQYDDETIVVYQAVDGAE